MELSKVYGSLFTLSKTVADAFGEALEMAARATGKGVERMATLRVRKGDLKVGAEYAVDLREERLVEQQSYT
jgi:hypothetical protein